MSERRNLAPLALGSILILAGVAFLALNLLEFQLSWLRTMLYVLPGLLLCWGLVKLYRHYAWEHDLLLEKPGRAGLLSGLFWTALGLTIILDLAGVLEGLGFFGLYWPFILVLFGVGRIVDHYRLNGRLRFRPAEVIGVLFVILVGVISGQAAQAHFPLIQFPIEIGDDGELRFPEVMGKSYSWDVEELVEAPEIETVDLSNLYGDVEVVARPDEVVRIRLTKQVLEKDEEAARAVAESIDLETSVDGALLKVRTNRPDLTEGKKRFKTHFRLEVPPQKSLKISNAYGDVSIKGLAANCEVTCEYGKVHVEDVDADVVIRNRYATAGAQRVTGNLVISNHRGRIEVKDISGDAELSTDYDSILARRIEGNLIARNQFGTVDVGDVQGTLDLDAPGSEVELTDITKAAVAKTSHKTLTARGIKDRLQVDTAYGKLFLKGISGALEVAATHSEVTAEEIGGSVTVQAVSTKISLTEFDGPCQLATSLREILVQKFHSGGEIQNEYGEIVLSPDGPLEGDLTVANKNGPITLKVSPGSSFRLSAVAKGGTIVSAFDKAAATREEQFQALETQIGSGGPTVRLLTTFAPITIEKR